MSPLEKSIHFVAIDPVATAQRPYRTREVIDTVVEHSGSPGHAIKTRCGMPMPDHLSGGDTVSHLTAETPSTSLLSDQALSVVQATAPVVAAHADEITAHF